MVPVIFHNLRGYDSYFIMQEIGSIGKSNNLSINCIPDNMEKYMVFMLGKHLVFLDSFQFMASSLERLAANLPTDAFKHTSQVFQDAKLALMKQKGVYPYDYMDSFQMHFWSKYLNHFVLRFLFFAEEVCLKLNKL